MKKNIFLSIVIILCMCLFIGCNKQENVEVNQEQQKIEQNMVIGVGRNFYYGSEDETCLHGSTNVWESLTYLNEQLEPMPQLAEDWIVSDDGKTWTFNLRKNVKFHDGTPFNADVAIYNLNRMLKHPKKGNIKNTYGDIEEITKVDEHTITIKHKTPVPQFLSKISYFNSAMFSISSFDENGNIIKPIGTGPFVFKDYVKDQSITVVKNENYWGEEPKLDKVVFKIILDPNTRLSALESGEIDALADVGAVMPEQAELIKNNDKLELKTRTVATTHYLHFNKNGIFKDNNLIQAVSMSFDREMLINSVLEGYGIPGKSVITPLATYWLNDKVAPPYDIEKAKELIEKSPKAKETDINLLLHSGISKRWPYKSIAEIIKQQLSQLGLNVNIEMVEGGLWSQRLKEGQYDITIAPYTLMTGEPNFFFGNFMLSEGNLNKNRSYGYLNEEADDLIIKAAAQMDKEKRREIYLKLQEIAALEGPAVPIYHDVTLYAVNKRVKNFTIDPSFKPDLIKAEIID